jgi:hypothetical protein
MYYTINRVWSLETAREFGNMSYMGLVGAGALSIFTINTTLIQGPGDLGIDVP